MAGSSSKVALIAGATGQDGAYLAEFLLSKGYVVHGVKRRSSSFNTERVDHLIHDPHEEGVSFQLRYGDVTDATNIIRIVQETQPDETLTDCRSGTRCCGLRRNVPACDACSLLQDGFILQSVRFVNPFKRANDRLIDEILPPS